MFKEFAEEKVLSSRKRIFNRGFKKIIDAAA
jgi:hypothetical protein